MAWSRRRTGFGSARSWGNTGSGGTNYTASVRMFVGADRVPGAPLVASSDGGIYCAVAGSNNSGTNFRIPVLIRAANGDILLFAEARSDITLDIRSHSIVMCRSTDNGATFGSPIRVVSEPTDPNTYYIANPGVGLWPATGRLHLIYRRHKGATPASTDLSIWHVYSDDHGVTWSSPADVTSALRVLSGAPSTPVGHPFPNTTWFDAYQGPCTAAYHPGTGRLVWAGYYRLTDGGTPYPYMFYTPDNGSTWVIKGPTQGATNQNAIEPAIALCPNGTTLLCNFRMKSGTQRSQSSSTDGGDTWSDISLISGPGNQSNQGCQGALLTVGNKMLLTVSDSTTAGSNRILPTVYQSDDNGATWGNPRRLGFRWAAYSALVARSQTEYLAVFEGFPTGTANQNVAWCQALYPHYFNSSLLSQTQTPEFHWHFDDVSVGIPVIPGESTLALGGTNIQDRGQAPNRINYNERAQCRDTTNQPVVGATGVSNRVALTLDSDSDYISLAPPYCYAMQPLSGQPFTLQIVLKSTSTSAAIMRSASSGARWMLDINANGRPIGTLSDGTNTVTTADTGPVINDGEWHVVVLRRTGSRVQMLIDGTQTQDLADTTGNLRQDTEVRLGCDHSGTSQLSGTIDRVVWTLGSVINEKLITVSDKGDPATTQSIASGSPASFSNLKLWLPTTYPRLWYAGWYLEAPRTIGTRTKIGCQSVRDVANGQLWRAAPSTTLQNSRASGHLKWDSNLGWIRNIQDEQTPGSSLGVPMARLRNADLDFIQWDDDPSITSNAFTIGCGVICTGSTGTTQTIFDNINGSGANNGFTLYLSNADPAAITFLIGRASDISNTSAALVARNQPYMILITTAGGGAAMNLYVRRIDTNTTPGSPISFGTSPAAAEDAQTSASIALGIGGRVGNWTGPGTGTMGATLLGAVACPFITNSNLSADDIQTYFTWLKNGPSRIHLSS